MLEKSFCSLLISLMTFLVISTAMSDSESTSSSFTTYCERENEFTAQDGLASLPATTCTFQDDSSDHSTISTSLICDNNTTALAATECPLNLTFSKTVLNYWIGENEQNTSTNQEMIDQLSSTSSYTSQFTIISDAILPHNNELPPPPPMDLTHIQGNFYTIDERWFRLLRKKNCSSDAFTQSSSGSRLRRTPTLC